MSDPDFVDALEGSIEFINAVYLFANGEITNNELATIAETLGDSLDITGLVSFLIGALESSTGKDWPILSKYFLDNIRTL